MKAGGSRDMLRSHLLTQNLLSTFRLHAHLQANLGKNQTLWSLHRRWVTYFACSHVDVGSRVFGFLSQFIQMNLA